MSLRRFALPAAAAGALLAAGAGAAAAAMTGAAHLPGGPGGAGVPAAAPGGAAGYFAASLNGRNEVPVPGGPATGDPDGRAFVLLRVQGDRLWYAVRWRDVGAPSAGHLHLGAAGKNGAVEVPLFGGTLPGTARAVSGTVKVTGRALARLRTDPGGLYANLHTGEFPGGAVRGQLHRLPGPADLDGVLNGDAPATLRSSADGAQEVPPADGKRAGDPDGRADGGLRPHGAMLSWAFRWSAVAPPTLGHVHRGARGVNGPVAADLFEAPGGLPAGVTGLAGMSPVDAALNRRLAQAPGGFYTNLHTGEFPGGAVRGQLAPATGRAPRAFAAPVLRGAQVYRCTRQPSGGYAFTQDGVAAVLAGGVRHTFAAPGPAGPPKWAAADGSAVTGKALDRTPNGAANIPELVLRATRAGAPQGLLAGTRHVLRLNTSGGVAPSGACDPAARPTARIPYEADYLFFD